MSLAQGRVVPAAPRKAEQLALPRDALALVICLDASPLDLSRPRQIFFQPFDLHLQAADLFVELVLVRGLVRPTFSAIGEELRHLLHQLLFPRRHLACMHAILARQLGRRTVSLGCRKGHLRLEGRPKRSPLPRHRLAPFRVPPTQGALP